MSEFRKYRIVSKLLECYEVTSSPQKFVGMLAGEEKSLSEDMMIGSTLPRELLGSVQLQQFLKELKEKDPEICSKFVQFAKEYYNGLEKLSRNGMILDRRDRDLNLTNLSREVKVEDIVPVTEALKIRQEVDVDLEKMTDKFEKPPCQGIRMLEMNRTQGDGAQKASEAVAQVKMKPFANDFEWSAGKFAQPVQELFIIEDLLDIINGISGRFIVIGSADEEASFFVDETLSSTILASITSILQAAYCFKVVDGFIEEYESLSFGRVGQALCACLRGFLQEIRRLAILLEKKFVNGALGLQQFKFHFQPYEYNLAILADFVSGLINNKIRGGEILRTIEEKIVKFSGDRGIRNLFETLLLASSKPFLAMVGTWLYEGYLDDPFDEFFIRPRSNSDPIVDGSLSSYFHDYVLVERSLPLLFAPKLEKVLQIGVYHKILQSHIQNTKDKSTPSISAAQNENLNYDQRKINVVVEQAFVRINQLMLSRIKDENRLNYDLFGSFLDDCKYELAKPATSMVWENVQSAWENTLQSSLGDFNCVYLYQAELSLNEQLQRIINADNNVKSRPADSSVPVRGLDVLSIVVQFEFPYTILFNKDNLSKYELLFRFLLRLVNVHRGLTSMQSFISLTKHFCMLRRQMLQFVQNVHQYLVYEVIEARWRSFMATIPTTNGMDQILQLHVDFIDSCLRQSMLTNAKLMQILNLIFSQCTRLINLYSTLVTNEIDEMEFNTKLGPIGATFGKTVRTFLEALQYYSSRDYDYHLGTLFSRLDFNSFYYANSFGSCPDLLS